MKTFLTDNLFIEHVQPDEKERKRIQEELDRNILDLKRIDCSIVFTGKIAIFFLIQKRHVFIFKQDTYILNGYLGIIALKLTNLCILILILHLKTNPNFMLEKIIYSQYIVCIKEKGGGGGLGIFISEIQVPNIVALLLVKITCMLRAIWSFSITFFPASVNSLHFHLLLQNHWGSSNKTWHRTVFGRKKFVTMKDHALLKGGRIEKIENLVVFFKNILKNHLTKKA